MKKRTVVAGVIGGVACLAGFYALLKRKEADRDEIETLVDLKRYYEIDNTGAMRVEKIFNKDKDGSWATLSYYGSEDGDEIIKKRSLSTEELRALAKHVRSCLQSGEEIGPEESDSYCCIVLDDGDRVYYPLSCARYLGTK